MKRFLSLILLIIVAMIGMAQERSVPTSGYMTFDRNETGRYFSKWEYTGTSSDYLIPTTRDTIDFNYDTKRSAPYSFDLVNVLAPIAGADTTVTIQVLGRNSEYETWSLITSTLTAVVDAQIVSSINWGKTQTIAAHNIPFANSTAETADTLKVPAQTITLNNVTNQFIKVRLILTGDDSVGTGVKVVKQELKLWF